MPDLFLIASEEDCVILRKNIESIGLLLRTATASTIPDLDNDPKEVVVWIIAHQGGDNIPPLQILGVASWKRSRIKYLDLWKQALAGAWAVIIDRVIPDYRDKFPADKTEIFPLMPRGSFGFVEQIVRP